MDFIYFKVKSIIYYNILYSNILLWFVYAYTHMCRVFLFQLFKNSSIVRRRSKTMLPQDNVTLSFYSVAAYFSLTSLSYSPVKEYGEHAETDFLRSRVHRPPRPPHRFAKVQVETNVGRIGLNE